MVAYYLPEMKKVTISSCIATSPLLKIAYKDQEITEMVDNTEEYGLIAIGLIGFEILLGVFYGLHRICKARMENQRITDYVERVQRDAILEQARLQGYNAMNENAGTGNTDASNASTSSQSTAPARSRAVHAIEDSRGAEASTPDQISHRASIHFPSETNKVRIFQNFIAFLPLQLSIPSSTVANCKRQLLMVWGGHFIIELPILKLPTQSPGQSD